MSKQLELREDMTEAMRAKDAVRLSVIRGLIAACTNELVAKGRKPTEELSDDEVLTVIARAGKQRKDSIEQFTKGNRPELAEKELAELKVLEAYLPRQLSRPEIEKIAREKMVAVGVTDKAGAGKLMGMLMKELKGRADGNDVKNVIDDLFK